MNDSRPRDEKMKQCDLGCMKLKLMNMYNIITPIFF